ncbi:MAG: hypothetical protein HY657_14805 [Acidobacteria bacterium]|nr:hypothetical protein [Acidobacteriota bacterium]
MTKEEVLAALEEGPWPSFVREMRRTKTHMDLYADGIHQNYTQFGYGGYVSVPEIGSGVEVRRTRRPEILEESCFVRVLMPGGGFLSPALVRDICELADRYGSGLIDFTTTAGTVEIKEVRREQLTALVRELNGRGLDVGSGGDDIRQLECCIGPARCEHALIDTIGLHRALGMATLEDQQFPRFPHKFKIRIAGCPNDCIRAVQRADLAIVGVFRDLPRVDQAGLRSETTRGTLRDRLQSLCPAGAMEVHLDDRVGIDGTCNRCMACINRTAAIRPGVERGVAVLAGGKLGHRGTAGAQMAKVIVPFLPVTPPEYSEVKKVVYRVLDAWDEHGRRKERLGDFMLRIGVEEFLGLIGVEPSPQIIGEPRFTTHFHCT